VDQLVTNKHRADNRPARQLQGGQYSNIERKEAIMKNTTNFEFQIDELEFTAEEIDLLKQAKVKSFKWKIKNVFHKKETSDVFADDIVI
jgi:hypothetical protein